MLKDSPGHLKSKVFEVCLAQRGLSLSKGQWHIYGIAFGNDFGLNADTAGIEEVAAWRLWACKHSCINAWMHRPITLVKKPTETDNIQSTNLSFVDLGSEQVS